MDIQTLHRIIIQGVSANTALLTDFLPGSINYTVTRGLAGGLLDLYQKLEELEPNFFITTAQGEALDSLGNSLGINRINGSTSTGYVLAQNTDIRSINLVDRTVLTDPATFKQYLVVEGRSINIPSYTEERLKIESLDLDGEANLPAGTVLISGQYSTINFIVGSYRSTNGEVTGNLRNAISPEPDLMYRQRIIDTLLKPTNNYFSIKQILINQGDINNVLFHTTEPGKVDVWFEPKTAINTIRLMELQELLKLELPLGVSPTAKLLSKNALNFKIKIYDFNLDKTKVAVLKDYIIMYLRNLEYRANLVIKELESYLRVKSNILLEVISPIDEIIFFSEGETFTLNALEVIYNA